MGGVVPSAVAKESFPPGAWNPHGKNTFRFFSLPRQTYLWVILVSSELLEHVSGVVFRNRWKTLQRLELYDSNARTLLGNQSLLALGPNLSQSVGGFLTNMLRFPVICPLSSRLDGCTGESGGLSGVCDLMIAPVRVVLDVAVESTVEAVNSYKLSRLNDAWSQFFFFFFTPVCF